MNNKQIYLAWVRTNFPDLYYKAISNTFGGGVGLSGLGDDLIDSISMPDLSDIGIPQDTTDAINAAAAAADASTSSGNSDGFFNSLANAFTSISNTVLNTKAAQTLLQINTQRAKAGLPLYTQDGRIVTPSMLAPTNATIAQMEAALSSAGGSSLWIIAAVVVGAIILTRGGSKTA